VFAIVVAATLLRQTGTPKWLTVWAEDGHIFAQCDYDRSFVECLTRPYDGYLHVVPRLSAALVTAFDPGGLPFGLALVSALVAGVCGVLVARAVGEATRSQASGLLAGISLALVWAAGREVSGNLANVHWIMFAASIAVLTCGWLGRRTGGADLALLALTALTSPFAPLLLAFGLGGLAARAERARLALGVTAVALVPQLIAIATSHRAPPARTADFGYMLQAFASHVLGEAWFGPHRSNLLVPALLFATIVALLAAAVFWRRRGLELVVARSLIAGAICAIVAMPVVGVALFAVSVLANADYGDRYVYLAAVLTSCAVAIGSGVASTTARAAIDAAGPGRAPSGWARGAAVWAPTMIVVAMGLGFVRSFPLATQASSGPNVVAEITAARPECASGAPVALVTISPSVSSPTAFVWSIAIPCERFGR
jgi:hypothetical protein